MNIGWFGLGKLGMICSEMIVDKGYSVTGYDIKEVESNKVDVVTDPRLAVENKDFVFVAVQTPHDPAYGGETPITHLPNKDFGIDNVKSCLKEINKYSPKPLIINKPRDKADVYKTYGDNKKIRKFLGGKIQLTDYKYGVKNTCEWFFKNRKIFNK